MSIRVIASVGVMLSLAMTSFSIYLGVVEHAYSPVQVRMIGLSSLEGRRNLCFQYQSQHNTTTTNLTGPHKFVPCADS